MAYDPASRERHESVLHERAVEDAPAYAAAHLPKLLHSLHDANQLALLSTIAGRGLEYVLPWVECRFDQQLQTIRSVSRGVLEDWNSDHALSHGLYAPQSLLRSWLAYRLDPNPADGGYLHSFLSTECGVPPNAPSIVFEGEWYPNPLAFATTADLPERLAIRAVTGHCHCDLHGMNVLVGSHEGTAGTYYLIDLAMYESDQFLFYDNAYFEMAYLLMSRGEATPNEWATFVGQLGDIHHAEPVGLRADDLGIIELVRALRGEVSEWIENHQHARLAFMDNQCLLARVAAGLNFANKRISLTSRQMAFIYAASVLKDYLAHNRVDWPKHGPSFFIDGETRRSQTQPMPAADSAMPAPTPRMAAALLPGPRTVTAAAQTEVEDATAAPQPARSQAVGEPADESTITPGSTVRSYPGKLGFFQELKRRQVVKVAGIYVMVGWACIQVASVFAGALNLPPWTSALVAFLLMLAFPITCVIAWAFELSPAGLHLTRPATEVDLQSTRNSVVDYLALAGITLIIAFTAGQYVFDSRTQTTGTDADVPQSLAVLPFRNLSADTTDDSFTDGLTIEIMNTLAQTGEFRMPGRTSSFKYKDKAEDIKVIGKTLNVDNILEGSVRRVGDRLRIEAQLVDAEDGFPVWAGSFDEKMADVFVAQENIAEAIGSALATPIDLSADDLKADRTEAPEAYDLFLRGLALLEQRGQALVEARDDLKRAVEIDPRFAAGWAALSLVYNLMPTYLEEIDGRPVEPAVSIRLAKDAALKAQKLDPELPIVNNAIGNMYERDRQWIAAEDAYRKALAADPTDHRVMRDLSTLLQIVGNQASALDLAATIRAQDPLNGLHQLLYAQLRWQNHQTETNINRIEGLFTQYPELRPVALRTIIGHRFRTGQPELAREFIENCDNCDGAWRDRAIAMMATVDTDAPEAIFEEYKDEVFVSYPFLEAIGGPDLVLEAFAYYGPRAERRLQFFTVPWSLVDIVGPREEFRRIAEDMGLVEYWRERGWPNHCEPIGETDFECG